MKFYISTTGMKRVTILNDGGGGSVGKGITPSRRVSNRAIIAAVLLLGTILPFLFLRIAFLVLESAAVCSSPLDCTRLGFFSGKEASMNLKYELTRALVEANQGGSIDDNGSGGLEEEDVAGGVPSSFKELVKDVTSNKDDIKTFAFKTKAMLLKMEHKVESARKRESIYWHLASHGVPKSLHCLCLKLSEEYTVNSMARSRLPPPQFVSRLSDPSFHHILLLTDNVLAASVVVSSAVQSSANPRKLVFHIITDEKTYTSMHAWFATNYIQSAALEVKGLHQCDWSREVNVGVKEMLEIQRLNWGHYYNHLNAKGFVVQTEHSESIEALSPRHLSLMNQLRMYLPLLFPDLNKVVFLDDDVIVQRDLSCLWELDLKGKVNGAVVSSCHKKDCCMGRKYKDYLNFSHPLISSKFNANHCGWLYGMNVFDLEAWRRTNITKSYLQWLKLSLDYGLGLWYPGVLAPSLVAFEGQVHPIDPTWHVAGLGEHRQTPRNKESLESAAVIHFSGPAKPWLEIGFPEVRHLWNKHVNVSNEFVRKCRIMK